MTATAAQKSQLRRMTALALADATYTDTVLGEYIERYALLDGNGEEPQTLDTSTTPPTWTANPNWIATYDLNAAAADIWEEKAAAVAVDFDFTADGGNYSRSQVFEQYMKNARHYRARRSAKTATLHKWPEEDSQREFSWIANLPEDHD